MSKELDIYKMLDFSEKDLTAPNKVVEQILEQLPENTQGIVLGKISEYSDAVLSTKDDTQAWLKTLSALTSKRNAEIQEKLGKQGEKNQTYECFLYTVGYTEYRYRMFFMQYGLANYPVEIYLEEGIAQSIKNSEISYTVICDERAELENLVMDILTSPKVLGVMQELIRIYQAKKENKQQK